LALALLYGTGCLALKPEVLLAGRSFPADRLIDLRSGMNPAEVSSILGEPLRRGAAAEGEVWLYESLYQLRACQLYLLFIPIGPSAKERRTATLTFADHRLSSVTLVTREGTGRRSTRRFL